MEERLRRLGPFAWGSSLPFEKEGLGTECPCPALLARYGTSAQCHPCTRREPLVATFAVGWRER